MENPIYLYDLLVVIVLVVASAFVSRAIWRRLSKLRKWWFVPVIGLGVALFSILLLHAWAQVRPLPVFVQFDRAMTEREKAEWKNRGTTADSLTNMQVAKYALFNETNAPDWSAVDIHELKRLLAWNGILPLFPKRIEVQQNKSESARAYYKWIGSKRKVVSFEKREGVWLITFISKDSMDGIEMTNFLDRVISRMPIDFKNF